VLDFSDHQAICSSVSHMTIFKICSELWHHLLKSRKEKCYYWLIQCHDIITFVIYTSSTPHVRPISNLYIRKASQKSKWDSKKQCVSSVDWWLSNLSQWNELKLSDSWHCTIIELQAFQLPKKLEKTRCEERKPYLIINRLTLVKYVPYAQNSCTMIHKA
jgi:hypothetical protein